MVEQEVQLERSALAKLTMCVIRIPEPAITEQSADQMDVNQMDVDNDLAHSNPLVLMIGLQALSQTQGAWLQQLRASLNLDPNERVSSSALQTQSLFLASLLC